MYVNEYVHKYIHKQINPKLISPQSLTKNNQEEEISLVERIYQIQLRSLQRSITNIGGKSVKLFLKTNTGKIKILWVDRFWVAISHSHLLRIPQKTNQDLSLFTLQTSDKQRVQNACLILKGGCSSDIASSYFSCSSKVWSMLYHGSVHNKTKET